MYRLIIIIIYFSCCITILAEDSLEPFYPVNAPTDFKNGKKAFENVMKIVGKEYYDSKGLTEDDLYYAAIQGILRRISPPKTPTQGKLWSRTQKTKSLGVLKTKQVKAGFTYKYSSLEGYLKVVEIEKGSASEGILKPYDRVMRINGESLKKKSSSQIEALLSGAADTKIKLKVVRDVVVIDYDLVLKPFKRSYTKAAVIDGCGYVKLVSFSEDIAKELDGHVKSFKEKKCKNLIIDLRQNTGGYFSQGIKTAQMFLKEGSPILSVVRSGSHKTDYTSDNKNPCNMKIAVLIDGYSASSSEILASALKKNNRAVLIGSKSYGKAITEKTFSIQNDYYIKFTIGAMYEIDGENWHENGLEPDIAVKAKIHTVLESDEVIKKAVSYLNSQE